MTSQIPAPAPQRVPTIWGAGCRYCERYRRPCGRHEDLSMWPAPVVETYRQTTPSGRHIRWATRVTIAGQTIEYSEKLPQRVAVRQAEEFIGRERGHQAFHAGRGNFPFADSVIAHLVAGAKPGEKTHIAEAFNRSWTRANLATAVPALF